MDSHNPARTQSHQQQEVLRKHIGDLHLSLHYAKEPTSGPHFGDVHRLRELIDQTLVGVYRSTMDGKLVLANAALARIFGYDSPDDFMAAVQDIATQLYVDPDRRQVWRELFHDQDVVETFLWQGYGPGNRLLWIEDRARVIRDREGQIVGYEGVVLDVTHRSTLGTSPELQENSPDGIPATRIQDLRQQLTGAQQEIAELHKQLDRYHVATKCSQEGLWEGTPLPKQPWDSPETPAWYSPQFTALLGFEAHEFPPVLGSWASCLHPDDRDRVFHALREHIEHRVPYEVESRLATKQGEYRWFKGKGQGIFDEHGVCIRGAGTIRDITAEKEVEEAIKKQHALLKAVIEGTSDIIFVKDHESRYLLINSAGAGLLKHSVEAVIGKTDRELELHGADSLFTKYDDEVMHQKLPQTFETDVEDAGAVSRTFLVTKETFKTTGEGLEGLLCIARDITFRKAAELTIQEREKRYRALMDNAYDLIAEVDGTASFLYASPNFQEVLGYSPQSLLGSSIFAFVHPEDREEVIAEFTRGIESIGAGCSIYRYRHQNGEYKWLESTGRVFRTALGDVRGVVVSRDITERKKAEVALQEMNIALTHATPGISLLNKTGSYLQVNEAYARFLGYSSEDLLGESWKITVHPEDHGIAFAAFDVMEKTGVGEFEARAIRKDGSNFYQQVVMVKGIHKSKNHGDYHCFMRDVTERKQMELALRESDQKLQHVQKMEAIGTLAGGIAHDFNNILGAILGYSELALAQAPKETRLVSYLQEILTAGNRAKDLVKQILAFSRRSDQEREAVDLAAIVQEALSMVRATIPTTIQIQSSCAVDSAIIFADSIQIHQVIMNLCANAEHAMRSQGGTLTLAIAPREISERSHQEFPELKPGSYLQLTVQDSGQGMTPQVLERVFEPFFTTKTLEGTGMGLAVVHGIVVSHGGHIMASSALGRGTTFTILLPRLDVVLPAQRASTTEWPSGNGRVLFVDDEDVLARWGEQILTHLGYTVVAKTNPHEAIELFRQEANQFDVVITDQSMPDMSGEAFARTLQAICKDIPIILCTGFSHTMSAERAGQLGLQGFLMKPVNGAVLAKTLRNVLENSTGRPQNRQDNRDG